MCTKQFFDFLVTTFYSKSNKYVRFFKNCTHETRDVASAKKATNLKKKKTSEMKRHYVLLGIEQSKLPLMLLNSK